MTAGRGERLVWARAAPSLHTPPALGKGSNPVYAPLLRWARAETQSMRPSCAGQRQHPVYAPLLRRARAAPSLRAPPALGKGRNPVYVRLLCWARAAPSLRAPPALGKGSTQSTRPSCAGTSNKKHEVHVPPAPDTSQNRPSQEKAQIKARCWGPKS